MSMRSTIRCSRVPLILAAVVLLSSIGLPFVQADDDALPVPRTASLTSSITQVEFDKVAIGQTAYKRFVLTNNGLENGADIEIYSMYLNEPDARVFTTDFAGPVVLAGGESYTIEVTFTPETDGEVNGALFISHNGESGLEVFTLSGDTRAQDDKAPLTFTRREIGLGTPSFGKSLLSGFPAIKPTSLQFGPDGRLYVADMLGTLKVLNVVRDDVNDYRVSAVETIDLVKNIPNHDDDGTLNATVKNRLVTGLLVTGTESNPVLYVASSDPRMGGGPSHTDTNLDTNSGVLSRLAFEDGNWVKTDLVRGLPRSEENHHGNGMTLSADGQMLYLAMGGNTNQGAISNNFALLPEFALSAAILSIDLQAIGNATYDLPTLDDETRPGVKDANDPFGGNDGRNQARLIADGPVQVYAPGFRNPYDIVLTESGRLYTIDNGPNAGWGGVPIGEGPSGSCSNALNEPGVTHFDALHHIDQQGYYGGHANPTRGNKANQFNASNPQSPVDQANPVECEYRPPGSNGSLTQIAASTNGLVEYRASNFHGAMQGNLLTAAFDNKIYRLELGANGDSLSRKTALFSNVGSTPLDVTAQADDEVFAGTVWVGDFVAKTIVVYEPVDYAGQQDIALCDASNPAGDSDGDGYSNSDEISNGTDPCSAADVPADADGDKVSDLNDDDDDNDGIKDYLDAFALDPANGRSTSLPVSYTWENNSEPAGFLFNMGFSGLMNNGKTDWQDQFDPGNLTAGGAAGVFTIDKIPAGDPVAAQNSQQYGFQFGIDVRPDSPPFTVHTRILRPFAGVVRGPYQAMGLYIGTGDQDNYIKWVANPYSGTQGGFQFAEEKQGSFQSLSLMEANVLDSDSVDLMLQVFPASGSVHAMYAISRNGVRSELVALGPVASLPSSWLTGSSGLAVGIIATSFNATPFTGTWDFMEVLPQNLLDDAAAYGDATGGTTGGTTDGTTGGTTDGTTAGDTGGVATGESGSAGTTSGTTTGTTSGSDTVGGVQDDGTDPVIVEDGLAIIEAERFASQTGTSTHQWRVIERGDAMGGQAVVTTPNIGSLNPGSSGSPMLVYPVLFDEAGVYKVFVRGSGDTNASGEGKNDSVHVGVNGVLDTASAIQNFPAGWHWSQTRRSAADATINIVAPGLHTINLWMREDGLEIDRLVLAHSRLGMALPSGIGPVTDSGSPEINTESDTDTGAAGSTGTENTTGTGSTAGTGSNTGTGSDTGDNSDGGTSGSVLIEAEDIDTAASSATHKWSALSNSAASEGQAMITTPDVGALVVGSAGSPELRYLRYFDTAGTYRVWVRGKGDTDATGEGKSDSLHVGLNGQLTAGGTAITHFPANWHWSNAKRGGGVATITVPTAGLHVVNVWMREDGLAIDRLLLTLDTSFNPNITDPGSASDGGGTDNGASSDTGSDADSGINTVAGSDSTSGSTPGDDTGSNTGSGTSQDGELAVLDGMGAIEMESFDYRSTGNAHAWQLLTRSGATGLIASPNVGSLLESSANSPEVGFDVYFDAPGDYRVWIRGWGDTNTAGEGKDDSVHVGIDGVLGNAAAMDKFPADWTWSSSRRGGGTPVITINSAGMHRVSVWMREDGLAIDKLVLVHTTLGTVPTGTGPGVKTYSGTTGPVWQESSTGTGTSSGTDTTGGSTAPDTILATTQWQWRNSANGSKAEARHEAGAVAFEGRFYLMGGRGTRQVSVYDPAVNTWQQKAAPPIEMNHFQPVVHGNRIWAIGAMSCCYPTESTIEDIYTYTPSTNAWATVGKIPTARLRGSMAAAVYNGKIYLVGGNTKGHSGGMVNWFDEYDPATGQWRTLPNAPQARDHMQVAVANGKLVVAAGRQTQYPDTFGNMVAVVDVYDFATDSWKSAPAIPTVRAGTMALTVGEEVLVIGGETKGVSQARNTVESYNVRTNSWRTLDTLQQGRHGGGAAMIAGQVHVVSGNTTLGGGNETSLHETLAVTPGS